MSNYAVFFQDYKNIATAEEVVFAIQQQYNNSAIAECLVICLISLTIPLKKEPDILEIITFLERKNNKLQINKFSINAKPFFFQDNNLAPITDTNIYHKLKLEIEAKNEFFYFSQALALLAISIKKPWGQELWYTGVEERGISKIADINNNYAILQPWFFAAFPKLFLGEKYGDKKLILVKILDPIATEITGDLYYELHQEKNEVYVVTEISSKAGQIKIGINPNKLNKYKNNLTQLKKDFLKAIIRYEKIRRKIDKILDNNLVPNAFLTAQEAQLREDMNSFMGVLNLAEGDIVAIPTLMPHALQHGVRVVEFQTPTYERLIISFAQKVLTQSHWDSKQALRLMSIDPPCKTMLNSIYTDKNLQIDLVCEFNEFYALRYRAELLQKYHLSALPFYQIIFVIKGIIQLHINNTISKISANNCIFIPANTQYLLTAEEKIIFLRCAPEIF